MVTDRGLAAAAGHDLVDVVAAVVDAGARAVLLREKDLPRDARAPLAERLQCLLAPVGGSLLVAGDAALAAEVGARGVHHGAEERAEPASNWLVGQSCHSVDELRAAQASGVDYATFSPMWATESKPGYGPALGFAGLAVGCAAVPDLPVYALGGVGPGRVEFCIEAGATGVAVMGGIMRADDPAAAVRRLLRESP